MPYVTIMPANEVIELPYGRNLLQGLLDAGICIDNACGGKGACGKCKVRILGQAIPEPTPVQSRLLDSHEISAGVRLACTITLTQDLEVEILCSGQDVSMSAESCRLPGFHKHPAVYREHVSGVHPSLTSLEGEIRRKLGNVVIPSGVLSTVSCGEKTYTAVVHEGIAGTRELMALEPGETSTNLYGIALDIGTTTLALALVDINSGEQKAQVSASNPQRRFGLDVLTRISYELEHRETGIFELQQAVVQGIDAMIEDVCVYSGISRTAVYEVVVAANCTMMHMLLGIDAVSIGIAPYTPTFTEAREVVASDIGIQLASGARLHCLASASAYVGADVIAGAYAYGLHRRDANTLFIDIGTNGEVVLSARGTLLCCSCAAGPALEGMNISGGMRALPGAVAEVHIDESGVSLEVIGDVEPVGICGSGILAAIRELLRSGIVTESGAFITMADLPDGDYRRALLRAEESGVVFVLKQGADGLRNTQGDIRQVQLAKGAIRSGIEVLLAESGCSMEDIDEVVVAGQFGAHLSFDSLVDTGIIPCIAEDRLKYVGNSAQTGALIALLSQEARSGMDEMARRVEYRDLATTEGYERLFIDCLRFPCANPPSATIDADCD